MCFPVNIATNNNHWDSNPIVQLTFMITEWQICFTVFSENQISIALNKKRSQILFDRRINVDYISNFQNEVMSVNIVLIDSWGILCFTNPFNSFKSI